MSLPQEKIADLRVKHLEMMQAIVARMAGYSATVKTYSITLASAIAGFSVTLQKPLGVGFALVTTLLFAILDIQYLRTERKFRELYNLSRLEGFGMMPNFEIDIGKSNKIGFWSALLSWSIVFFYIPLLICITGLFLLVWWTHGRAI